MKNYITTLGSCSSKVAEAAKDKGILLDAHFTSRWLTMFGPIEMPSRYIPYLVKDWLRERYNIHIEILSMGPINLSVERKYSFNAYYPNLSRKEFDRHHHAKANDPFDSYEEALEYALLFCIKLAPSNTEMREHNYFKKRNQNRK